MAEPNPTLMQMTAREAVARTAWAEDRSGSREGMHAVINVIANRVRNPRWWGHTWQEVCFMPEQFSSWNPGYPNGPKVLAVGPDDELFADALELAEMAIQGDLPDLTQNADSYYAAASPSIPFWTARATFTVEIGGQRFYRTELSAV